MTGVIQPEVVTWVTLLCSCERRGWGRASVTCPLGQAGADQLPRPSPSGCVAGLPVLCPHGGLALSVASALPAWRQGFHGSPVNVLCVPGACKSTGHRPGGERAAVVLPLFCRHGTSFHCVCRGGQSVHPPGENELGCPCSRGDVTGPRAGAARLICVSCFCNYRFALASHLFWGLWSIVQAKISSIEFGYMVRLVGGSFSLLLPGENATVYVNAWR